MVIIGLLHGSFTLMRFIVLTWLMHVSCIIITWFLYTTKLFFHDSSKIYHIMIYFSRSSCLITAWFFDEIFVVSKNPMRIFCLFSTPTNCLCSPFNFSACLNNLWQLGSSCTLERFIMGKTSLLRRNQFYKKFVSKIFFSYKFGYLKSLQVFVCI